VLPPGIAQRQALSILPLLMFFEVTHRERDSTTVRRALLVFGSAIRSLPSTRYMARRT
jgi:hypothetical protein